MELVGLGAGLIVLMVAMVVVARPRDGETAPFLKSWPLGQFYALVAMSSGVGGIALIIVNWPR